ncbi:MAG: hypothetical protein ACLR1V_06750 [Coprococcus sp.]
MPVGSDEQNDVMDSSGAAGCAFERQLAVDGLVLDDGDVVRTYGSSPGGTAESSFRSRLKRRDIVWHYPVQQHRRILKCFHGM